jgi:hypothetical protein
LIAEGTGAGNVAQDYFATFDRFGDPLASLRHQGYGCQPSELQKADMA